MAIEIRPAKPSEIDILLSFEKGIIQFERPFDSCLKEGEIHYYDLIELIKSDNSMVVVAEYDGVIVGSGYAKIVKAEDYLKFEMYAHLGFMYVKKEYRGQGINKIILENLMIWAKNKYIGEIRLEVYDENEIAKKAYVKAGFKPNMLEMRMSI